MCRNKTTDELEFKYMYRHIFIYIHIFVYIYIHADIYIYMCVMIIFLIFRNNVIIIQIPVEIVPSKASPG